MPLATEGVSVFPQLGPSLVVACFVDDYQGAFAPALDSCRVRGETERERDLLSFPRVIRLMCL